MEALIALIFLLLGLFFLVLPLVALLWARDAGRKADALRHEVTELLRRIEDLEAAAETKAPRPPPVTPDLEPEPEPEPEPEAPEPEPLPAAEPSEPPIAARAAPPEAPARSVEETLTSQWMIWLGAVAVALSAVFLFRYAIDQGWLTPLARVLAGLALGGLLLAAGEWTERRPVHGVARAMNPDYVPPALTASGIFAVYAALFAAHGLFGLMGPATAFVALGLTSYAALGLALRQGWFVALIGLAGGYLTPALIDSPAPRALPLFLYLGLLSAGCLGLMVWRRWWWFAALTLIGALAWPLLWLLTQDRPQDQGVLSAYALGLAALFALLSTRLPLKAPDTPMWRWMAAMLADTSGLGFTLSGMLLLACALRYDFNAPAFVFLGLYGALALGLGAWRGRLESLAVAAALIGLAAFLLWPAPAEITPPQRLQELGLGAADTAFGPFLMPAEFHVFARALWGFAALFGLGGFLALPRGRTAAVWAGLSAAMPVILFAIAYWRIGAFEIDIGWAGLGLGLAGLLVLAATLIARRAAGRDRDVALAFYAAGATAAIALAFACLLREAWLTVALAAEVLALAWIWDRLRVAEIRAVAALTAGVVLVRLVLNPAILDYRGGFANLVGWVIYGYGLPAAAMAGAARIFARGPEGPRAPVALLCEILAAGFAFLMVAFQLKLWTSGTLRPQGWDLFDSAVQVAWWSVATMLLLDRRVTALRPWPRPAGLLVLLAAGLAVGLGHVLSLNPLWTGEAVGTLPLLNLLGLAYLLPALIFWALGALSRFDIPTPARRALLPGALGLVFLYLTLETRRSFWGPWLLDVQRVFSGNAEIYAYSAVWLVFALTLLALGIWRHSQGLRYGSLAVLIVTVVKVFLYDMSDLTGLYRVVSFLGLGLVLIGIGRVYQRHVFRPRPAPEDG
ncbi:DUF2339 domain-containing protein [Rhodovulum marinum]|uniref:Putative membrane protein n=1 Tax=Rhodovulum marinum TaxID=320662 RepID=A0A4R2Q300_9RHOB|nr:DUF2339 domain-containing protein [Rhodovulum marinum]TCP42920.1 putative membrane protein [Rhodovulum marinum]